MKTRLPVLAMLAVLAALLLGGCGLFGDADAEATEEPALDELPVVRVVSGPRWFETTAEGLERPISEQRLALLRRQVDDLSIEPRDPTNSSVVFRDGQFVGVAGIDGEEPDIDALAENIVAAAETGLASVDVPFEPIPHEVPVASAASFAAELNARTAGGLMLSVETELQTLSRASIASATRIRHVDGEWSVRVRWADIAEEIAGLFPDVGTVGGDASFEVLPSLDPELPGTVRIVPGPPTTECCDSTSVRRIEQSLENDINVARLFLHSVDSERGTRWAENLQITERVGTFTTNYTPGQDRVTNIRRFAELIQGVVIEPGETLSLNEYVGRRTTENGFVPAGTIINGHLVDSVGGGISQFATTIFNAAFFAGLEFDTYQSHSIYFSRYPYGREATISWPAPDLQIHNPTPYGVLIWPTTTASSVTVDIYSTAWAVGEQTGQTARPIQEACTRVTTERTRTFVDDGRTETDTVIATYRPEGIACDGTETDNPDEEQVEKLENGEDPNFENEDPLEPPPTTTTTPPTTTPPPPPTTAPTTTTTIAPTTTTTIAPTTTTTTTTTTTPEPDPPPDDDPPPETSPP